MKKLYNLFMMAMLSMFVLTGCGGDDNEIPEPEPKPDPDKVTLGTSSFTAEADGKTVTISFTTNKAWTASADQGWCKLDKTSGAAGTISMTATLEANTSETERTVKITIKAGTASQTATIKQAGKQPDPAQVEIKENSFSVEAGGKAVTITFTTNKAWTASADQSWCTLDKASGEAGTITLTATVAANDTEQERTATITVKAGEASATATIKQDKKATDPQPEKDKVEMTENSFSVAADGKAVTITFTTNKAWTASADQSWCTLDKASGEAGTITLTATVAANETEQERTATITVKAGEASATATIKQAKKAAQGGQGTNGGSIDDMENKKW